VGFSLQSLTQAITSKSVINFFAIVFSFLLQPQQQFLKAPSIKTTIVILPHQLPKGIGVLSFLHVKVEKDTTNISVAPLKWEKIQQYFAGQPAILHRAINNFSEDSIDYQLSQVSKKFTQQSSGKSFADHLPVAKERILHDCFTNLKPLMKLLKPYHQQPAFGRKDHFRTAPCRFSEHTPILRFEVAQNQTGFFYIQSFVSVNGHPFLLDDFQQFQFLLESKNEYFLLRMKDYKTLEWLSQQDWTAVGSDAGHFSSEVLSRLELDYEVERNNLLEKKTVDVAPAMRVMLSEISNAFLVLTPQFDYDGFVVEGKFEPSFAVQRHGEAFEVLRRQAPEQELVQWLIAQHPNFVKQLNGYYYLSFADAQKKHWFLKVYQALLEKDVQVMGMDLLKHFRYSAEKLQTTVQLKEQEGNLLLLQMELQIGKEKLSLVEVQKMLRNNQFALLLKDGSIAVLEEEWQAQYGRLLKHATIDKNNYLRVPKWMAITESESTTEDQKLWRKTIPDNWWQQWQQWQVQEKPIFDLPANINAELRPYQQKGFEWLRLLQEIGAGACLADDMGLGKTLQTICFIAWRLQQFPEQKVMIVCPASLIYNWLNELNKFATGIRALVYHGGSRNQADLEKADAQVIISSYGTVRSDELIFSAMNFGLVVLDESHNIKNPAAQVTKVMHRLNADGRVVLSGTPIMNNTFDLYSQLQFVLPGLFGSQEFFKKEYADAIDLRKDAEKVAALKKMTAPFILRRTKEQVARDLPPKTEMVLWCEMSNPQRAVYEEIRSQVAGEVMGTMAKDGLQKSKLYVLQGIMKLRQVCNSPLLLKEESNGVNSSIKIELLIDELVNNLSDHKVLVFSQFTSMLDLVAAALKQQKLSYLMLTGSTAPKDRDSLVQQFNDEESEQKVFLLSLKAGNAGLNLTAADYVFLVDPWWNTAVEQQAIDRAHRIGQTKNVFAYKMICRDTIEEKIVQLQQRKQKISEELISEEDGFVKALTEEDVQFLFS
jgi:SNF2 family DNA or RNA helicase